MDPDSPQHCNTFVLHCFNVQNPVYTQKMKGTAITEIPEVKLSLLYSLHIFNIEEQKTTVNYSMQRIYTSLCPLKADFAPGGPKTYGSLGFGSVPGTLFFADAKQI